MAAESFNADERTDMPKLTVDFLNFANAPKNFTLRSGEKFTTLTEEFVKKEGH